MPQDRSQYVQPQMQRQGSTASSVFSMNSSEYDSRRHSMSMALWMDHPTLCSTEDEVTHYSGSQVSCNRCDRAQQRSGGKQQDGKQNHGKNSLTDMKGEADTRSFNASESSAPEMVKALLSTSTVGTAKRRGRTKKSQHVSGMCELPSACDDEDRLINTDPGHSSILTSFGMPLECASTDTARQQCWSMAPIGDAHVSKTESSNNPFLKNTEGVSASGIVEKTHGKRNEAHDSNSRGLRKQRKAIQRHVLPISFVAKRLHSMAMDEIRLAQFVRFLVALFCFICFANSLLFRYDESEKYVIGSLRQQYTQGRSFPSKEAQIERFRQAAVLGLSPTVPPDMFFKDITNSQDWGHYMADVLLPTTFSESRSKWLFIGAMRVRTIRMRKGTAKLQKGLHDGTHFSDKGAHTGMEAFFARDSWARGHPRSAEETVPVRCPHILNPFASALLSAKSESTSKVPNTTAAAEDEMALYRYYKCSDLPFSSRGNSRSTYGRLGNYHCGGYLFDLPFTATTKSIVDTLGAQLNSVNCLFVDNLATRMVSVRWFAYVPQAERWIALEFLSEMAASGELISRITISAFADAPFVAAMAPLLAGFGVTFVIPWILGIFLAWKRRRFLCLLCTPCFWYDFIIVVLACCSLTAVAILAVLRSRLDEQLGVTFSAEPGTLMYPAYLEHIQNVYSNWMLGNAVVVVMLALRLVIKYALYVGPWHILVKGVATAFRGMLGFFTVAYAIVLIGYVLGGWLLFGASCGEFSTITASLRTLLSMAPQFALAAYGEALSTDQGLIAYCDLNYNRNPFSDIVSFLFFWSYYVFLCVITGTLLVAACVRGISANGDAVFGKPHNALHRLQHLLHRASRRYEWANTIRAIWSFRVKEQYNELVAALEQPGPELNRPTVSATEEAQPQHTPPSSSPLAGETGSTATSTQQSDASSSCKQQGDQKSQVMATAASVTEGEGATTSLDTETCMLATDTMKNTVAAADSPPPLQSLCRQSKTTEGRFIGDMTSSTRREAAFKSDAHTIKSQRKIATKSARGANEEIVDFRTLVDLLPPRELGQLGGEDWLEAVWSDMIVDYQHELAQARSSSTEDLLRRVRRVTHATVSGGLKKIEHIDATLSELEADISTMLRLLSKPSAQ